MMMYCHYGERQRLAEGIISRIKENGSVFLGVFIRERQKLLLPRIEANSHHSYSEHVLVRLLF